MEAHHQYGNSLVMESSDLIADGGSVEKNMKVEVDFFSQDFVPHQSNSSCSISQDAFINNGLEAALGKLRLIAVLFSFAIFWSRKLL